MMSGAWIKFEHATLIKPEVMHIARALLLDRDAVVGKLFRVWVWFDTNSVDGVISLATDADLDALVGTEGFAQAVRDAGWLESPESGQGLRLPKFDRHNSASAKQRAMNQARKSRSRHGETVTSSISPSSSFNSFWETWPRSERKGGKAECWSMWHKRGYDLAAAEIIGHVTAMKKSKQWLDQAGEFIPAPKVYLNQKRWDGAEVPAAASRMPAGMI